MKSNGRQVALKVQRPGIDRLVTRDIIEIEDLDGVQRSVNDGANRRSFSTVVGALIIGAAIVSTNAQTPEMQLLSNILFGAASILGVWLLVKIIQSDNSI